VDILIPENITGKALGDLTNLYSIERYAELWNDPEKLTQLARNAKALLVRNQTKVDKRLIDNAEDLLIIGRAGVGCDNIDVEYASKKGIVICYTPDENTIATAELAIGLMFALARKIPSGDKSTKAGNWDRMKHLGDELYNKTLGIVGFGKIGKAVAARAHSLGMEIITYDKYEGKNTDISVAVETLEELLRQSDIITAHLPLSDDTKNIFNKKTFNLMKPGSLLINTSRGGIIAEDDLISALETGKIKGAALDVRLKEPPDKSKLNDFENVILTPHVGGLTRESQERVVSSIAKDIDLVLSNKPAIHFLNFAVPKLPDLSND
jgi:D-3-phosphoglycerate dehydrogenase